MLICPTTGEPDPAQFRTTWRTPQCSLTLLELNPASSVRSHGGIRVGGFLTCCEHQAVGMRQKLDTVKPDA